MPKTTVPQKTLELQLHPVVSVFTESNLFHDVFGKLVSQSDVLVTVLLNIFVHRKATINTWAWQVFFS